MMWSQICRLSEARPPSRPYQPALPRTEMVAEAVRALRPGRTRRLIGWLLVEGGLRLALGR